MKRIALPLIAFFALPLIGCAGNGKTKISLRCQLEAEQISFAQQELKKTLESKGYEIADGANLKIEIAQLNDSLGEEEYKVTAEDGVFTIVAGGLNGAMYGAFDLSDKIAVEKDLKSITSFEGSPDIEKRGIKFDLPLDARTPSYGDQGDSAQKNIEHIYDFSFWKEEFDALARDKYNAITVWSLNPFPSMVKVDEYPDVALADVWRTKIPFDSSYSGTADNFVREEHWQEGNYEIVKTMTIDEKIDHWKKVMGYAHSRGIEFYMVTWNIYTFGEHGKYGITSDVQNETTKDYYRKSVKAMFETYPDLDGIGCTAGENMDWSSGNETLNESWLRATYGAGIDDYLSEHPEREIRLLHRLHFAEFDMVEDLWSDFKGTLDYSDNYSKAHMFSSRKPTFTDEIFSLLPAEKRIFLELRSDDFYIHRYGNPNFVRDYFKNMPGSDKVRGVWIGGDGYCRGRDFSSKDPSLNGGLHYKKDWFNNAIIGRLAYDKDLTNDYFLSLLKLHFPDVPNSNVEALFDCLCNAGEILPEMTMFYFINGDAAWYPEGCFAHPNMNGFIGVKKLINASNVMQDAGRASIKQYMEAYNAGDLSGLGSLLTPEEVAQRILGFHDKALEKANIAKQGISNKEFVETAIDQEEFAYIGEYFAHKIIAVVNLRKYNDQDEADSFEKAKQEIRLSKEGYSKYAESYSKRYVDQRLSRAGDFFINDVLAEVVKDIDVVDQWRKRTY